MIGRLSAALAAATTIATLSVTSAEAAGNTLQGTVSWTTTVTTAQDVAGGNKVDATETRQVTMRIKMTRENGRYGWQPQDNGSSFTGKYQLSKTTLERDIDGTVECTTVHSASIPASGNLKKKPTSTTPPAMFADIDPATSSLSSKTKRIRLTPLLSFSGNDTVTATGSGNSPCEGYTETDPIDGSLAPSVSAQQICLPAGTSTKGYTPNAGDLIGKWDNKKKAFVFTCSKTWADPQNHQTTTTTINGVLKLK